MERYFQHASHKKKVVSTINNIMQIDCLMSHYSLYKSSEKRAKTIKTSTMSMCVCSPFPKQVFHYLSHHSTNIPFQTSYFGCVLQKNSYSLRTKNYFFQIPFPFLFILDTPQKTSVLSDSNYKWFADDFGGAVIKILVTSTDMQLFIYHNTWKPLSQNRSPLCRELLYRERLFLP